MIFFLVRRERNHSWPSELFRADRRDFLESEIVRSHRGEAFFTVGPSGSVPGFSFEAADGGTIFSPMNFRPSDLARFQTSLLPGFVSPGEVRRSWVPHNQNENADLMSVLSGQAHCGP